MTNHLTSILFALCMLMASNAFAQTKPFIEKGKSWHLRFYSIYSMETGDIILNGPDADYDCAFTDDCGVTFNGVEYQRLTYKNVKSDNYTALLKDGGTVAILREDNGRVYQYNPDNDREVLLYDFTLNEGDEFELEHLSGSGTYQCKVEDVSYVEYNGQRLKSILITSRYSGAYNNEEPVRTRWTECIGGDIPVCQPAVDNELVLNGGVTCVAYITYTDCTYIPVPIDYTWVKGRRLTVNEDASHGTVPEGQYGRDDLKYELTGDNMLHVYGTMWTSCSPNQYLYLVGRQSAPDVCRFAFEKVVIEPVVDSQEAHYVDLYFEDNLLFDGNVAVYVMDNEGEHRVVKAGTSVSAMGQDVEKRQVYDIAGKRVLNVKGGNVYVQNGRKFLKR